MRRDMESQNLSAELCRESSGTGGISCDFSSKEVLLREELSFLSDRAHSVHKIFLFFAPPQFWSWLGELDMRRDTVVVWSQKTCQQNSAVKAMVQVEEKNFSFGIFLSLGDALISKSCS
ncbi:hypothetical protein CEXT_464291 [Caerostris extrusa]|uniref:Uncharacterized protein n=1 Tax=Caerostris extrusa TaxID=172846 RepID=A0AAV4UX28_CAEEX|nr:hypothetical protein CEXT_464291 [Caerostris extrusa]